MTFAMSSETATSPEHSRATIMAKLATVLRDCDASITNIESAIAKAGVSVQEISARFGEALEADEGKSLRTALLRLGNGIMSALMSRAALGLYKVAVSESSRFGAAANAYWEYAPKRAIETARKVLVQAQLRGEVNIDDPAVAARQFVAMLRGDIHLEILFGLRSCPDPTEIHVRVTSAVDLLLNGAEGGFLKNDVTARVDARQQPSDDWRTEDREECRTFRRRRWRVGQGCRTSYASCPWRWAPPSRRLTGNT